MVAVAILGSGVIGAGASIYGASQAANAQTAAANKAASTQEHFFDVTQNNLKPFMTAGADVLPKLTNFDQNALESTPGYKFALGQGLKSVQNSFSARLLGGSGAAEKGAASYATGLADNTYGNQFNRLMGLAQLGENAGAGVGQAAISTGAGIAQSQMGAGNAQAAAWNAGAGAVNNNLNNISSYYMAKNLLTGN